MKPASRRPQANRCLFLRIRRKVFVFLAFTSFIIIMTYSWVTSTWSRAKVQGVTRWKRPSQFLDSVKGYHVPPFIRDPGGGIRNAGMGDRVIRSGKQDVVPYNSNSGGVIRSVDGKPSKTILLINNPDWDWLLVGQLGLQNCPFVCTMTTQQEQLEYSDAVIFYAVGYQVKNPPPKREGQVWIYFLLESPYHSLDYGFEDPEWRGMINWTMTYLVDSDVWYPYGRVNSRENILDTDYTNLVRNKTKQVAWFVSHCSTYSQRERYVTKMAEYISVDTYGLCSHLRCGREGSRECFQLLSTEYKFYLSFENAMCDAYVTEKLFMYMERADIVPIVYGLLDYSKYLPPKSYINTEDFSSVKQLTDYLIYLDQNDAAYMEYLQWKNYYYAIEKPNPACEVCMKLYDVESYRNQYKDVYGWWHNGRCFPPRDIV